MDPWPSTSAFLVVLRAHRRHHRLPPSRRDACASPTGRDLGSAADDRPRLPASRPSRCRPLNTKGWLQEAALRCLLNNLDPAVAEDPENLIVYGGRGKAARNLESLHAIVRTLERLENDETLLVQSGKPVGVFRTHEMAPRVLIANSLLVPRWATLEHFWKLEAEGLMMYGQMTAGSWIYIGSQGILQGTYQTFAAIAEQRFGGSLAGTLTLTAGLGGMGGAQPLAVTMNGGVALCVDVDPHRIERRLETRYLDESFDDIEAAVRSNASRPRRIGEAVSDRSARQRRRRVPGTPRRWASTSTSSPTRPRHTTRSTATCRRATAWTRQGDLRGDDPDTYIKAARESMATQCEAMVGFQAAGAETFDYGNNLRGEAEIAGFGAAFSYPGFVPAYIRPLFCEGSGPFRWVALSGDPADIAATDRALADLFPDNEPMMRWLRMAGERVEFQGLPARICWLSYGERHLAGLRFNELVASGEVSAPIVIGRDHLDSGSVASPYRETEAMADGSDAVADWPILNAMLNVSSGAAWVAVHHGGGVGIGNSIHAGAQVVADGTDQGALRVERVLTNDPGTGVMRHADAGYEIAQAGGSRARGGHPDAFLKIRGRVYADQPMPFADPYWPRADVWLAQDHPGPDILVVGVPSSQASLSPSRADMAPLADARPPRPFLDLPR